MHNLQIEQTPIHALHPQDRNARTHSKRQIRQIAASIRQFGFNNPILTDDNLHIIAALPSKADMRSAPAHVCFGPEADIVASIRSPHRRGQLATVTRSAQAPSRL